MINRSEVYFQLSQSLKWLSHTYSLCVVVVNQVTSTMDDNLPHTTTLYQQYVYQDIDEGEYSNQNTSLLSLFSQRGAGGGVLPALGLAWAHCINTRSAPSILR
jgi:hypothetical protein